MADDLFSQMLEMFNQPGPVNWKLAGEVTKQLSGEPEPVDPWLAEEYRELTRLAQLKVGEGTDLPLGDALDADPVDRATWARQNLQSFRYLVEPLAEKLGGSLASGPLEALLKPLGPALLGMQMGAMVGFLSHRVFGQFDAGLPTADQPALFMVVPNIESFARDEGLDPRQVRLWVALHEVAHQAEFAVPWLLPHFLDLIEQYLAGLRVDQSGLMERFEALRDPEELQRILEDPSGLTGLVTTPEQRPILEAIQALMAFVEGYAEFVVGQVGAELLPDLESIRAGVRRRRAEPTESETMLDRLLGLEMSGEHYVIGAGFCDEVIRRWGEQALNAVWEQPENLPTLAELEDPVAWTARVLLDDLFA
jgi:putative hydrolase